MLRGPYVQWVVLGCVRIWWMVSVSEERGGRRRRRGVGIVRREAGIEADIVM